MPFFSFFRKPAKLLRMTKRRLKKAAKAKSPAQAAALREEAGRYLAEARRLTAKKPGPRVTAAAITRRAADAQTASALEALAGGKPAVGKPAAAKGKPAPGAAKPAAGNVPVKQPKPGGLKPAAGKAPPAQPKPAAEARPTRPAEKSGAPIPLEPLPGAKHPNQVLADVLGRVKVKGDNMAGALRVPAFRDRLLKAMEAKGLENPEALLAALQAAADSGATISQMIARLRGTAK